MIKLLFLEGEDDGFLRTGDKIGEFEELGVLNVGIYG